MTITTTRCPRCSRMLLGEREVPIPYRVLPGGIADKALRAHIRKHGRPSPLRELPRHDAKACDLYLARVLTECHGYVLRDGEPVGAALAHELTLSVVLR